MLAPIHFDEIERLLQLLHSDLRTSLHRNGCLYHPLVTRIGLDENGIERCNSEYLSRIEMVHDARAGKDWRSYVYAHKRWYRVHAFAEVVPMFNNSDYWSLLARI